MASHSYKYSRGFPASRQFIGWAGNQSAVSIEEVAVKISTIQTTQHCPTVMANFKVNNKKLRRRLGLTVSRGVYPSGRCCRATAPAVAERYPVYELDFLLEDKHQNKENIKGFKIILSDLMSSSIFQLHKFNMEGSPLELLMDEKGYRKYRLKMFMEVHLENDPKFPCRIYSYAGEYDRCLEEEYVRKVKLI